MTKNKKDFQKKYEELQEKELLIPEELVEGFHQIDSIQEMASIDLGDSREESSSINTRLWSKFKQEMFYTVIADLSYEDSRDYFAGEVDTDTTLEYELIKSSLKYNN